MRQLFARLDAATLDAALAMFAWERLVELYPRAFVHWGRVNYPLMIKVTRAV